MKRIPQITANINFTCTWEHADVQKLFDELLIAGGISELGLSMIFTQPDPIQPTQIEQPLHEAPTQPKQEHLLVPAAPALDDVQPNEATTFKEDRPIPKPDLGRVRKTSDPRMTYRAGISGGVVICRSASKLTTTLEAVRALPDKIPPETMADLKPAKQGILRKFKKWLTESESTVWGADIDPYGPILKGGAKVDTRASGKVEGFLE